MLRSFWASICACSGYCRGSPNNQHLLPLRRIGPLRSGVPQPSGSAATRSPAYGATTAPCSCRPAALHPLPALWKRVSLGSRLPCSETAFKRAAGQASAPPPRGSNRPAPAPPVGIHWSVPMSPASQPRLTIKVNGKWMDGLLDTGAEISCIPLSQARDFPLTAGPVIVGATGQSSSQQAAEDLAWHDTDGRSGFFRPLVLRDIKQVLWGRDILHQSGAVLFTSQPSLPPQ